MIIRRLQVALEFMVIVGMALGFLIPLWLYMAQSRMQVDDNMKVAYVKNSMERIAKNADIVYAQENGSASRVRIYNPATLENASIVNNTIRVSVRTSYGTVEVVSTSMATLNGSIPLSYGYHYVTVKSMGDYVQIGEG